MKIQGEQHVLVERQRVWDALNDPEILRQCIPGCQSLERDGENRFKAIAEVKIGPIGARFKGTVELSDLDAPNGYTITGSGSGGIAGSAKGAAFVRLKDAPDGTALVVYDVDAEVGGRMAQLGGPIIDATAKNLAGKFFSKLGEVLNGGMGQPSIPSETPANTVHSGEGVVERRISPTSPPENSAGHLGYPLWPVVVAIVVALLTGFILGQYQLQGMVAVCVAVLLILVSVVGYELGRRGRLE